MMSKGKAYRDADILYICCDDVCISVFKRCAEMVKGAKENVDDPGPSHLSMWRCCTWKCQHLWWYAFYGGAL